METETALVLSHKEFLRVDRDYEKAAETVNLVYVSDRLPGILRNKKGKGFSYVFNNRLIKDRQQLGPHPKTRDPTGLDAGVDLCR